MIKHCLDCGYTGVTFRDGACMKCASRATVYESNYAFRLETLMEAYEALTNERYTRGNA